MGYEHISVMLNEILEYLQPKLGDCFVDGTLGGGGYANALAKIVGSKGRVVAFDLDELALNNEAEIIKKEKLDNIILIKDNFRNLNYDVREFFDNQPDFNGMVFDLGLSSAQLADRDRSFSFKSGGPLNMAFGPDSGPSTYEIINTYPEKELARIIYEYGEERMSRRIAENIVKARRQKKITKTQELVEIIFSSFPAKLKHGKIHPATKTFQALRIATNRELENLELVLPQAVKLLKPGGRIVIVSFHSLEDRIVKNFFRSCPELKVITKKIVLPTLEEQNVNPRSRSAKLRVAEKI